MPLIDWKDVSERYPDLSGKHDATVADSAYCHYAVKELEARLSSRFTVPFSSNNITAKDLAIDLAYAKVWRYKDTEKAEAAEKHVKEQVDMLLNGSMDMLLSNGTTENANIGDMIYSTSKAYTPIFGLSPTELSQVDSSQILDEEADRGRTY